MTCVELQVFNYDGTLLVNNRVVLPVPEIEEYQAKRRKKKEEQESQKRGRAIHVLLENGIIEEGDIVVFNQHETRFSVREQREYDPEEDYWRAEVTGKTGQSDNVRWLNNGKEYSFTLLTKELIEDATGTRPNSVNGYKYWRPEDTEKTLSQLRNELGE